MKDIEATSVALCRLTEERLGLDETVSDPDILRRLGMLTELRFAFEEIVSEPEIFTVFEKEIDARLLFRLISKWSIAKVDEYAGKAIEVRLRLLEIFKLH